MKYDSSYNEIVSKFPSLPLELKKKLLPELNCQTLTSWIITSMTEKLKWVIPITNIAKKGEWT